MPDSTSAVTASAVTAGPAWGEKLPSGSCPCSIRNAVARVIAASRRVGAAARPEGGQAQPTITTNTSHVIRDQLHQLLWPQGRLIPDLQKSALTNHAPQAGGSDGLDHAGKKFCRLRVRVN